MGLKEFNLLLDNVSKMTDAVEKLPADSREMVYSSLVDALLRSSGSGDTQSEMVHITDVDATMNMQEDGRNVAEELNSYYSRFRLNGTNDMEFAAFVAYFYAKLAPPNEMTDAIDVDLFKKVCVITGRKLPKRVAGTMNNAKNVKYYLVSRGGGKYSLAAQGEHYVKHTLLKESD